MLCNGSWTLRLATSKFIFLVEKNADTNNGEILTSSPLGEALMGGLSGEEVEYTIGKNDMLKSVRILDVTASA